MATKVIVGALVVATAVVLPGCSWSELSREEKGTIIGAGGGAGLGALIGAATGSTLWGAVIGAAGGALAGYVIADVTEDEGDNRPPVQGAELSRREEADSYFRQAMNATTSQESEFYLQRSIETYPNAPAYNNLGLLYLQAGDRVRAEEAWQNALRVQPGYRPAQENLDRLRNARSS